MGFSVTGIDRQVMEPRPAGHIAVTRSQILANMGYNVSIWPCQKKKKKNIFESKKGNNNYKIWYTELGAASTCTELRDVSGVVLFHYWQVLPINTLLGSKCALWANLKKPFFFPQLATGLLKIGTVQSTRHFLPLRGKQRSALSLHGRFIVDSHSHYPFFTSTNQIIAQKKLEKERQKIIKEKKKDEVKNNCRQILQRGCNCNRSSLFSSFSWPLLCGFPFHNGLHALSVQVFSSNSVGEKSRRRGKQKCDWTAEL